MENASKALLIAAAVLIAIVLISVGVKLLSGTRETQEKVEIVGSQLDSKNNEFYDDIRYNLERIDGFLPREKVKELFAFLNLSFDENKYNWKIGIDIWDTLCVHARFSIPFIIHQNVDLQNYLMGIRVEFDYTQRKNLQLFKEIRV